MKSNTRLSNAAIALDCLAPGAVARITTLGERLDPGQCLRLLAYGLCPGGVLTLLRQQPMTVVVADEVEIALERVIAKEIWVQKL